MSLETSDREPETERPDVIVCADGPILLRGDHVVADESGALHRTTRPVSAICRCGRTGIAPWCDGSHKVGPRKRRSV